MSDSAETSSSTSPSRAPSAMRGATCQAGSAAARRSSARWAPACGSNETIRPG